MNPHVLSIVGANFARPTSPAASALEAKQEARIRAHAAALDALAHLAEAAARAGDVGALEDDLPPTVSDGMRRLSEHIDRETQRMTVAMRNGGRVR